MLGASKNIKDFERIAKRIFATFDMNKNGIIEKDECTACMRKLVGDVP